VEGELSIRRAVEDDAARISEIYNWYVVNTAISFETSAVPVSEMKHRISEKLAEFDWIIGESNRQIVGYAYYGTFRPRAAYHHTVETTVYISRDSQGKGFGKSLYFRLLQSAAEKRFREAVGIIALPNPASLALHAALGFREIGILRGVGCKFGAFHDIALWQRSLQTT